MEDLKATTELEDYSGPLKPELKPEDLSRAALLKLFEVAIRGYTGTDGLWQTAVKNRFGEDVAKEMALAIWFGRGQPVASGTEVDVKRCLNALNIKGNNVETFLKLMQVTPLLSWWFGTKVELRDEKHGTLTVTKCISLAYYERHNKLDAFEWVCKVVDGMWLDECARLVNPKIKVTPVILGGRKSTDAIHCQYEITMED